MRQNMKEKIYKFINIKSIWFLILIPGLFGLILRFATGEKMTGYGSYVPWGLWIAVYFHAVGIAGGAFVVGAVGYLRKIPGLRENLKTIILISFASLVTGLLAIWLDLGHPFRFYRVLISPNFGSMLAFNAWIYISFLVLLGFIYYFNQNKKSETQTHNKRSWLVPLLTLGIFISIAFPSQSGAFFGVVDAKPFWSSAILPILFFASAITSGASALFVCFYYLGHVSPSDTNIKEGTFVYLRRIILCGIFVYFVCEFSEYSLALWSPISDIKETVLLVLFGKVWWGFWIIHIGGTAAGLYLLIRRGSIRREALGAFVIGTTFISTRMNILVPGQSIPELKGLYDAFVSPRLSFFYSPSILEYLILLFILAFGMGLLYFGHYYFMPYLDKTLGRNK
jgi:molybdopterin-containing oxidoreductase family membrane subunit